MRRTATVISIGLVLLLLATQAQARWDPTQPAKWVQMPDLTSLGLDVMATYPKVLADDFPCRVPMPITDIHIWGSWRQDVVAPNASFQLSIHADRVGADPSMPGEQLWCRVFGPDDYQGHVVDEVDEAWFNPNTNKYIPNDHQNVWQYNFFIPTSEAFYQVGTSSQPMIYWLDVSCLVPSGVSAQFGWKTSLDHWRDDAVYGHLLDVCEPAGDWKKLVHPETGVTLDMAFVITPEPVTAVLLGLGGLGVLIRRRRR